MYFNCMNKQNSAVKQCIISSFGRDVIGLVGLLSSMIAESGGNIVDIVENVTHGYFNIFFVVDLQKLKIPYDQMVERLHSTANQTGLHLVIEPADQNVPSNFSSKLILMILLGPDRPGIVARLAFLAGNYGINLEQIRMIARGDLFAMEVLANAGGCARPLSKIRTEIKKELQALGIGMVFQTENIYTHTKRLIVFDVDSDVFSSSFADAAHISLSGTSFNPKVLTGVPTDLIQGLAGECRVSFTGVELIRTLHMMGYRVALLSSGLKPFLSSLGAQIGIDYIYGNRLKEKDKIITGALTEPRMTPKRRQKCINEMRRQEGLRTDEVIVIGKKAPGIPKSGLSFRYQGTLLATAVTAGRLSPEQVSNIAAQFTIRT